MSLIAFAGCGRGLDEMQGLWNTVREYRWNSRCGNTNGGAFHGKEEQECFLWKTVLCQYHVTSGPGLNSSDHQGSSSFTFFHFSVTVSPETRRP